MVADKNDRKRVRLQPAESSSHCPVNGQTPLGNRNGHGDHTKRDNGIGSKDKVRERFIHGRYGFLNGQKTILLDADLNLYSKVILLNRSDLMYVGKTTNTRIFIVIDKNIIYNYSEMLKGNWIEMHESVWFKLLTETLYQKGK